MERSIIKINIKCSLTFPNNNSISYYGICQLNVECYGIISNFIHIIYSRVQQQSKLADLILNNENIITIHVTITIATSARNPFPYQGNQVQKPLTLDLKVVIIVKYRLVLRLPFPASFLSYVSTTKLFVSHFEAARTIKRVGLVVVVVVPPPAAAPTTLATVTSPATSRVKTPLRAPTATSSFPSPAAPVANHVKVVPESPLPPSTSSAADGLPFASVAGGAHAARVAHLAQLLRYLLARALQDAHQVLRHVSVRGTEEAMRHSRAVATSRAADAVHVVLNARRLAWGEVEVDHALDVGDI